MKRPDDPEVSAWLAKVAEDYRVAEALADLDEPLEDAICFHCQQAAEKLLKALLVAAEVKPPRTHDLEELGGLLEPSSPPPDEVEDALTYLTEFAVIPRYPIRAGLRAPDRADRARRDLQRLIAWVEERYGWEVPRQPAAVETDED